jgi:hypothetical protein
MFVVPVRQPHLCSCAARRHKIRASPWVPACHAGVGINRVRGNARDPQRILRGAYHMRVHIPPIIPICGAPRPLLLAKSNVAAHAAAAEPKVSRVGQKVCVRNYDSRCLRGLRGCVPVGWKRIQCFQGSESHGRDLAMGSDRTFAIALAMSKLRKCSQCSLAAYLPGSRRRPAWAYGILRITRWSEMRIASCGATVSRV